MSSSPCPVCNEASISSECSPKDAMTFKCPRCGDYNISRSSLSAFHGANERQKSNISGWLRENPNCTIHSGITERLLSIPTPSFHEQADKLLSFLERRTTFAGQEVEYNESWISWAWCISQEELAEIIDFLGATKRIKRFELHPVNTYKILPDGWAHLEKLKETNPNSQQGFVAMWFHKKMEMIYTNAIAPGIENAGYRPHKVNLGEYTGKICDEIIAQIRRSRFVVADFTGHRGGVYYEAGFAKGLGLEVIWTCHKHDMKDLHFDIRQYNCIEWDCDNLSEFRTRLKNRIESVLGRGTYHPDLDKELP